MVLQVTVNAVSIPLVFADIAHQPRSEKATKNIVQHLHFHKVWMMAVGELRSDTDSALHTIRIVSNSVLFLFCSLWLMVRQYYLLMIKIAKILVKQLKCIGWQ